MSFPNRIGTNSSKWRISETNPNMVSASLADMDFEIFEGRSRFDPKTNS